MFGITAQLIAQKSTGAIKGNIVDEKGQPITGAIVEVTQNGTIKGGAPTDFEGNYLVKPLKPGKYTVIAKALGYQEEKVLEVLVTANSETKVNFKLQPGGNDLEEVQVKVKRYEATLIDKYQTSTIKTSGEIERLPTRNTSTAVPTMSDVLSDSDNGSINIGGARGNGTSYIIDGVQVYGARGINLNKQYYNPSKETFTKHPENDFKTVKTSPLSTISIDVDRASYSNVRRYINNNQKPPADAVRIEEMINYFEYNYPQPEGDKPLAIVTELTRCPWNNDHQLLHIGMQAKKLDTENLPASNLVFLIDVSGSMSDYNKLPLVKQSMKLLTQNLRAKDKIAIVVYAGNAGLVLPSTTGDQKATIYEALDNLDAGGSTAGGAGIKLAYKVAAENYIRGGNNRIVLATDGDFNVGISGENQLERLITQEREKGIYLTCLGYGMGNYKDSKLEVLADKGNGNYAYIDNTREAKKTLVKEFGGTIFTLAKDVKTQIEFNPAKVSGYRLIGYENRLLNDEDFKDDKKDAGEMGSGHTVTIMYEIIPANINSKKLRVVDDLKYQQHKSLNYSQELATIKFRYKKPNGNKSMQMAHVISGVEKEMNNTSKNLRFASSVAMFGMLLKKSEHKGNAHYKKVITMAKNSIGKDKEGYRSEFIELVEKMKDINGIAENDNWFAAED